MQNQLIKCTILIGLIIFLIPSGCARSPQSRFYLLQPISLPADIKSTLPGQKEIGITIGPIIVPKYLDRPQIVTQNSAQEIKLAEFERWAEPLKDNISRVLAENLATLLNTDRITIFPRTNSSSINFRVIIEILSFTGELRGNAYLKARWTLWENSERNDKELMTKIANFTQPTAGTEYKDFIFAQSQNLSQLSEEIAQAIKNFAAAYNY